MVLETVASLNPGVERVHRRLFGAFAVFGALMGVMGIAALLRGAPDDAGIGLIGIVFLLFALLHRYAASGARLGKASGRLTSQIIAIRLFGFPLGTCLAIYIFYKLVSKWKSSEPAAAQPSEAG